MNRRKYIFAIYGKNAESVMEKCSKRLVDKHLIFKDQEFIVFENQVYDTGLPKRPVSCNGVSLHFHGIIFPKKCSIDQLSEDREAVLCGIIRDNAHDLKQIPYSIRNGSYVSLAVDHKERRFLAFTSFLNSIPFYYAQKDGCVIVSTDLELLAKALNLSYVLNDGVLEYYACGTNISDSTAFPEIKGIPKGAYLDFKDGAIKIEYYYRMPNSISKLSFSEHVDKFAEMWEETVQSVHSDHFRYGLGLTGGIDSRLILAAMPDRSKPLLYTGYHHNDPDVVLAKRITQSLGLENHLIEDYSFHDRVKGYAKYSAMADNSYNCNSQSTHEQMLFRKNNGLVYRFFGLTDLLGGIHTYRDKRNAYDTVVQSLPLREKKLTFSTDRIRKLICLGLRNQTYFGDIESLDNDEYKSLSAICEESYQRVMCQIGSIRSEEAFLERFRHIFKINNLLVWNALPARRYTENLSPYMNMEMTDFSCRIPLKQRECRRVLFSYLAKHHPELSRFVLSGYIFSVDSPWMVYKFLSPYIVALNHLGISIPFFQSYIKQKQTSANPSDPIVYDLQRRVCMDSRIITETKLCVLLNEHKHHKIRLMRLYNIALMEKKMSMDEDSLNEYLCDIVDHIRYNR